MIIFQNYFVLVQSGGGGGNLANTILEDEVMAEHNEDTSLLSACRNLMTSITKVRMYAVRYFPEGIFPSCNFPIVFSQVATSQMCNFPSGNFPKVRLGPLRRPRLKWGPSAAARIC